MEQNQNKKIWFRRKLYGWGWTPITWQGWGILLLYVVAMVLIFINIDKDSHSASDTLLNYFLPVLLLTALLIFICYKTGEKPRWQWGKRVEDK